jgi:hypothetical protein
MQRSRTILGRGIAALILAAALTSRMDGAVHVTVDRAGSVTQGSFAVS